MKKPIEWLNAHWGILVGVWAAIIAVILIVGNMPLSDRIQAASVITLAFITWFYAVQTQRLVNEERKKRNAEFGVRRIKEFLFPFLNNLESLKDSVSRVAEADKNPLGINFVDSLCIFNAHLNGIKKLFIEYLFMTDPILRYGYLKVVKMTMPKAIERQSEEFVAQWKEGIDENIDELRIAVNNEITRICQNIRKTYGFFLHDKESRESLDDLIVLSDKPPTRI
jgi:hypothetical protein